MMCGMGGGGGGGGGAPLLGKPHPLEVFDLRLLYIPHPRFTVNTTCICSPAHVACCVSTCRCHTPCIAMKINVRHVCVCVCVCVYVCVCVLCVLCCVCVVCVVCVHACVSVCAHVYVCVRRCVFTCMCVDVVCVAGTCHCDSIYCDSNIPYYFNPKFSPRVHSFSFPIVVFFRV